MDGETDAEGWSELPWSYKELVAELEIGTQLFSLSLFYTLDPLSSGRWGLCCQNMSYTSEAERGPSDVRGTIEASIYWYWIVSLAIKHEDFNFYFRDIAYCEGTVHIYTYKYKA